MSQEQGDSREYRQTLVVFTVFSKKDIGDLTLSELQSKIDGDVFLSSPIMCDEKLVTPMELSDALIKVDVEGRNHILGSEAEEEQPHVQFEYDLSYRGGDYDQVGQFAHVPEAIVDEKFGGDMNAAFRWWTGFDPVHIINWSPDDRYTFDGEPWNHFAIGD